MVNVSNHVRINRLKKNTRKNKQKLFYSKSKETINYLDAMILLIVIVHCYASVSVNAFVKKAIMEEKTTTTKTWISFFFPLGRQIITVKKKKFQNK